MEPGAGLPETGEADVDEEVRTTAGDEEDTDRGDWRGGWSQRGALFRLRNRRAQRLRRGRGRALTEDGDNDDEDGADWVGHCVLVYLEADEGFWCGEVMDSISS